MRKSLILAVMLAVLIPACSDSDTPAPSIAPPSREQIISHELRKHAIKEEQRKAEAQETGQDYYPTPPPGLKLEIVPSEARSDSVLGLIATGFSLEEASEIIWLAGRSEYTPRERDRLDLKQENIFKGSEIRAMALVGGQEIYSRPIKVMNSKPVLTRLRLMPETFNPGDKLYADVKAEDPDGDQLTFEFQWRKNDLPVGYSNTLTVDINRGDTLTLLVIPHDDEGPGPGEYKTMEIVNQPPMFLENRQGDYGLNANLYTLQLRASDPDEDPLAYSLVSGPKGMTVTKLTGSVRWEVPADFTGKQTFQVQVDDGHGGIAKKTFHLTIGLETVVPAKTETKKVPVKK